MTFRIRLWVHYHKIHSIFKSKSCTKYLSLFIHCLHILKQKMKHGIWMFNSYSWHQHHYSHVLLRQLYSIQSLQSWNQSGGHFIPPFVDLLIWPRPLKTGLFPGNACPLLSLCQSQSLKRQWGEGKGFCAKGSALFDDLRKLSSAIRLNRKLYDSCCIRLTAGQSRQTQKPWLNMFTQNCSILHSLHTIAHIYR